MRQGEATGVVVATGARTYFGRTTQLVESARPKLHVEEVVTRVVSWLFVIVGIDGGRTDVAALVEGQRLLDILPISLVRAHERHPGRAAGDVHREHGGRLERAGAARRAGHAAKRGRGCRQYGCSLRRQDRHADDESTLADRGHRAAGFQRRRRRARWCARVATRRTPTRSISRFCAQRESGGARYVGEDHVSFVPFSAKTRRTEAVSTSTDATFASSRAHCAPSPRPRASIATAIDALQQHADRAAEKGVRALAVARAEGEPTALGRPRASARCAAPRCARAASTNCAR